MWKLLRPGCAKKDESRERTLQPAAEPLIMGADSHQRPGSGDLPSAPPLSYIGSWGKRISARSASSPLAGPPYPQPRSPGRVLASLPSSGGMSPAEIRLSLMRARRRFSSSGFDQAGMPAAVTSGPPRRSVPSRQSPGSYLAQLRQVPCPPRQPHARRESGAA